MRPIDADALKDKLQQHHDFYVMAWGGFGKMPIGEKKRVDEITNCIAEVVNAPTIESERGEWIVHKERTEVNDGFVDFFPTEYECSNCGLKQSMYFINSKPSNFCPNCGADMREREGE